MAKSHASVLIDMSLTPTPLDARQQTASILTSIVRNNVEDLHAGNGEISDALMKQLNQRIRNAIYTGLHALALQDRSISARKWVEYHLQSIPAYWEPPQLIPDYTAFLEPETDGASPLPASESPDYQAALAVVRPMLEQIAVRIEGHAILGAEGATLRHRMEQFAVSRYLKLSPKQREEGDRLRFIESNMLERIRELSQRGSGPGGGATPR